MSEKTLEDCLGEMRRRRTKAGFGSIWVGSIGVGRTRGGNGHFIVGSYINDAITISRSDWFII
jgi:hypothetical protein